jgi:uncharacterized SAM-binding protein YcdF (DUF218 family)
LFLLAVGLLAVLYLARGTLLPAAAAWLDVGRPPQSADAIMLLTGDAETRAFAAAALYKAGWAPRIVLSTVANRPPPQDPLDEQSKLPREHEINLRVLLACGVPRSKVVILDGQARSTYDEAVALAAYLAESSPQRLLVVTNGYHTRRARWIFQRVLGGQATRIAAISAPMDDLQADNWWRSEEGFAIILGEYLKLGFYGLRYGNLGYGAAVLVLLLVVLVYRRNWLMGKDLGQVV